MSTAARALGVVLLALGAGCGHAEVLKPAAGAQPVPNEKNAAMAETNGVRLIVDASWNGNPGDLWQIVTPVKVTIENHGSAPVRVEYKQFELASSGLRAHAMPPFQIQRPGSVVPYYPMSGFFIARPFAPWYPGLTPWGGPFDWDPFYFDTYYQWRQPLPSRDMITKALPVGVLEPNGRVTGYLYFQKVAPSTPEVVFSYDVVDASSGNGVGKITIPLVPSG